MPNHDLIQNDCEVNMNDWEEHLDVEGGLIMDLDDEHVFAGEMELNEDFEASDYEEAEREMELAEELERDEHRATQLKQKFQASLESSPCGTTEFHNHHCWAGSTKSIAG